MKYIYIDGKRYDWQAIVNLRKQQVGDLMKEHRAERKQAPVVERAATDPNVEARLKVRDPAVCHEEILPSGWHDLAEKRGVPDEQIYASWRKFKQLSGHPWERKRWEKWVSNEKVFAKPKR